MTNLQVFLFDTQPVRILGTPDDPLFVAKDVLEAIGSSTTVSAVREMVVEGLGDEFVINQLIPDALGRDREMLLLTEPALTLFISRSRTELGKRLNRWIHAEVLPAIRKTGSYSTEPASEKLLIEREKTERERVKAQAKLDELRLKHELKLAELEHRQNLKSSRPVNKWTNNRTSTDRLKKILELSERVGTVSARNIQQGIWEYRSTSAQDIRSDFLKLEKMGYGQVEGTDSRLKFKTVKPSHLLI